MSFFQAVFSGIVQGLAEFLPVSSSGHLVILHKLIGLEAPQLIFDIFLHIGTVLAVFIVLWKDIIELFTIKRRVIWLLILATLTTVIFVLFFSKRIEAAFGNIRLVGLMLIITGVWLFVGSFIRFGSEGFSGIKAVLIGLAQGIAALPGISRSGATISTALFLGIDAQNAVKFSFLLSIPAIIGAFLFKVKDISLEIWDANYFIGLITSCITGILALRLLLKTIYSHRFHLFGIYCFIIGIVTLIFIK